MGQERGDDLRVGFRGLLDCWIASPIAWGLVLAFGLAGLLRQYLFAHSYWYDEAFLVLTIRERTYVELLGAQPYNLAIPPGFLWLTRALYEIAGDGELVQRLPAFLAGVASLLVMIPLTRTLLAKPNALIAFGWLAFSRHLVFHSCDVRPYTFDLLMAEVILLCTATIFTRMDKPPAWTFFGLGIAAVVGPWLSFPSAFALAGASLGMATSLWPMGGRRGWLAWLAFNALAALSGFALWWFSARHMYYAGMIEHWGARGWWGFPDWQSAGNTVRWVLSRPYEIANYGTRDLGIVLALLALVGAIAWFKNARLQFFLLVTPFVLALMAALFGKYPLAHRTSFFLSPCLWLLAARGAGAIIECIAKNRWRFALAMALLLGWDFGHAAARLVKPDGHLDYRGAYQYVHAHRQSGDVIWAQMSVVYETYYGKHEPILRDADSATLPEVARHRRLWVVIGGNGNSIREQLESVGSRTIDYYHVSGLTVLLFEPSVVMSP